MEQQSPHLLAVSTPLTKEENTMQSIAETAADRKRPTRRALGTHRARVHNGHRWEAQSDWYRAEEEAACRRVEAEERLRWYYYEQEQALRDEDERQEQEN